MPKEKLYNVIVILWYLMSYYATLLHCSIVTGIILLLHSRQYRKFMSQRASSRLLVIALIDSLIQSIYTWVTQYYYLIHYTDLLCISSVIHKNLLTNHIILNNINKNKQLTKNVWSKSSSFNFLWLVILRAFSFFFFALVFC